MTVRRFLPYCQNWDIPRLLHCSLTPTRLCDADPGVGGCGAWEAAAWNTKHHITEAAVANGEANSSA